MSRVVLTLTTLPTRIVQEYEDGIKSNINALINQSYGDYEIHFNVPYSYKRTGELYVIPTWMRELSLVDKRFKIYDGLEDLGTCTKIVHTLHRVQDDDAILIVCDDDLVYHEHMVAEQVRNQMIYPNTAVGYDGVRCEEKEFPDDDVRQHYVVSVCRNIYVNHLQHYKTVSYRRRYFTDDYFTDFVGKSWTDDIITAAHMSKNGIKRMVTHYQGDECLDTIEKWKEFGGVKTFPVIKHTSHEGAEGCNLIRMDKVDENYDYFLKMGYLK